MIFRLSQKVCTKIKAASLETLPLDENLFADWTANLFVAAKTQYILLCNTQSFYSTVMYGKGITNERSFSKVALSSIRDFLEADGQESGFLHFDQACENIRFAKALNRSVTGSMNDMILHATMWLVEDELSPHDIGFKLNEIPFSPLKYVTPRKTFMKIVDES